MIYFPIDSLLPEKVIKVLPEVIAKKLSGKEHNRIRTVKLRGEISQGLALKVAEFPLDQFMGKDDMETVDITRFLGVEKYEPPETFDGDCPCGRLPEVSPYYDIEGCDRNAVLACAMSLYSSLRR
jgi:RNA ligase (TIGR02306 family)